MRVRHQGGDHAHGAVHCRWREDARADVGVPCCGLGWLEQAFGDPPGAVQAKIYPHGYAVILVNRNRLKRRKSMAMNQKQIKAVWIIGLGIAASVMVALGSNIYLGFGTLFALWCITGIVENGAD